MRKRLPVFATFLLVSVPADTSRAASCTVGSDCFCDCVQNTDGPANDFGAYANYNCGLRQYKAWTHAAWCEDAEEPALHDDVGEGNGSWCDGDGGSPFSRGAGSAWTERYGQSGQECGWELGEPVSPTRCSTHMTEAAGAHAGDWHPTDLWQINSKACLNFHRWADAPEAAVGAPVVFDGETIMGERVGAGSDISHAVGQAAWSPKTSIAVARAVSFSSNYLAQKSAAVKFDEWTVNGDMKHHWDMMGSGDADDFPFSNLLLNTVAASDAACEAAASAATVHVGEFLDNANKCSVWLRMRPGSAYSQATDWPNIADWKCPRGSLKNLNGPNTEWKVWIGEKLVLHVSGLDTTGWGLEIDGIAINHLWNQNQPPPDGGTPTSETTMRWIDNWVVLGWTDSECANDPGCGIPPTCQDIGYPRHACDDGIDNDADGQIDFPDDPDCSSYQWNDEARSSCGLLGVEVLAPICVPGARSVWRRRVRRKSEEGARSAL